MRRAALLGSSLLVVVGALPASAQASFHLQKVTEVMLAVVQGPYKLVVYDAAGTELGEHVLSGSGMSDARAGVA